GPPRLLLTRHQSGRYCFLALHGEKPMASLELRNQTFRVVFMFGGRKYGYSLDTSDRQTAEGFRGGVEKTLMLLSQGALALPAGADVVDFVRNGGRVQEQAAPAPE